MVNFLPRTLIVALTVLVFWIYFFFRFKYFFYSGFPSFEIFWLCCCLSFHWLFLLKLKRRCNFWSHFLCLFLCWLGRYWDVIIWEMFQGRASLNLVLLLLLLNFVSGASLKVIHIFLIINFMSSLNHLHDIQLFVLPSWCNGYHYCKTSFIKAWTQALRRFKSCSWRVGDSRWGGSLTIIPVENKAKQLSSVNHTTKTIYLHYHHHHFCLHQRITVALLKWSSDRLVIAAKGFLKLSNLFVLIKLKRLLLPKHFAYVTFGKLLRVFSTKVNQLYLLYIMTLRCFFLHVMFSKNVCWKIYKNSYLDKSGISLPASPLEIIWSCIIFL